MWGSGTENRRENQVAEKIQQRGEVSCRGLAGTSQRQHKSFATKHSRPGDLPCFSSTRSVFSLWCSYRLHGNPQRKQARVVLTKLERKA